MCMDLFVVQKLSVAYMYSTGIYATPMGSVEGFCSVQCE